MPELTKEISEAWLERDIAIALEMHRHRLAKIKATEANRVPKAERDIRDQAIVKRRKEGASLRQIASEFGITHSRVDQILQKA